MHDITNAGETYGLLLTLNVQMEDYLPETEAVGVKILIHDQDEPIFVTEGGFALMPGRKAFVSVIKKQVCNCYIVVHKNNNLGYTLYFSHGYGIWLHIHHV